MKEKSKGLADYKSALVKKALGYDTMEIVEEYSGGDDGEIRLTKKKITTKNVPPDLSALKLLLEENDTPISELSDEQLESEKQRLLSVLSDFKEKESKIAKKKSK